MATKKSSVKKVEITDESVVDLKEKKVKVKVDDSLNVPVNFNISKINHSEPEITSRLDRISRSPIETHENNFNEHRSVFASDDLHRRIESFADKLEQAVIKVSPQNGLKNTEKKDDEPMDKIKVKFEKFVQLVATKDFLSILEKNKDEDIIMSSNLLAELASAVEEKEERKSPVIFLVGLAIGVIITYLFISH